MLVVVRRGFQLAVLGVQLAVGRNECLGQSFAFLLKLAHKRQRRIHCVGVLPPRFVAASVANRNEQRLGVVTIHVVVLHHTLQTVFAVRAVVGVAGVGEPKALQQLMDDVDVLASGQRASNLPPQRAKRHQTLCIDSPQVLHSALAVNVLDAQRPLLDVLQHFF